MKKLTIVLLFIILSAFAFGQKSDIKNIAKVSKVAANALKKQGISVADSQNIVPVYISQSQEKTSEPYFYIFNGSNGFVIISGNEKTLPVLGYSTSGTFDANNIPTSMAIFLKEYENEIKYAREQNIVANSKIAQQWNALASDDIVSLQYTPQPHNPSSANYLVKTEWNQQPIYNNLCPVPGDDYYSSTPTGCVATAMAQIIRYWGVDKGGAPKHGYGKHSYIPKTHYEYGVQSADFACCIWDFTNMPISLDENSSEAQKAAVSKLMYYCGVSVDMDYNTMATNGGSESVASIPDAFTKYFGYGASYHTKSEYSNANWASIIKKEITEGRPVFYRGDDGSGEGGGPRGKSTHAWVCDGYDNSDYFHMNWGWSGVADGWFLLSALNPDVYDDIRNYNYNQGIIINIQPQKGDYIIDSVSAEECEGNKYEWLGKLYDKTGVYKDTISCDTIKVLNLIVHPKTEANIDIAGTICDGESYYINEYGEVYKSGIYTKTTKNKFGCDSVTNYNVTLNITPRDTTIIYDTICIGKKYTENGFDVSGAGTYTLPNGNCGTKILYLAEKQPENTYISDTICKGKRYTKNGFDVSEAGTYTQIGDCGTTVLYLTEKQPVYTYLSASICKGDEYTENGFNVTSEGEHRLTLTAANGCDSIVILNLKVNNNDDCDFNINISTEGSVCQANGTIRINLLGSQVANLSQINYSVTGNNNTYSSASPVFTNLANGTYTVTVTATLNGKQIVKTLTITLAGSYVVPVAVKVVGVNTVLYGTRPSFNCINTGRVQLKITGGIFPYIIKVYSGETLVKTETFYSRQNLGTEENKIDYKDYYSIDNLAAGSYKFVVTDGCDYVMPEINETIDLNDNCLGLDLTMNNYSGNQYVDNIIKFNFFTHPTSTKYYYEHTYGYNVWWEYSYSYDGGVYTPWKDIPQNGIVSDTVQNASKYCDIWNKQYNFKIRVKGCNAEYCTKTFTVQQPSYLFDFSRTSDSTNDCAKDTIMTIKYNYYSSFSFYYTPPLQIKITNVSTGKVLSYSKSDNIYWQTKVNITKDMIGQTININVIDKNGCAVIDKNEEIKAQLINFPNVWSIYRDSDCKESYIYLKNNSEKIAKGTTIQLIESPENKYKYKAEYDYDTQKWNITENQPSSVDVYGMGHYLYLKDDYLLSGRYKWIITNDCGNIDTISSEATFYKYQIKDSLSFDIKKECDGTMYYPKGQIILINNSDTVNVPTKFSVVSGVSGGYSSVEGNTNSGGILITKPGTYVVKMFFGYNYNDNYSCVHDFDTIIYKPQNNVAIKDAAGYVCINKNDNILIKPGNIIVKVDSATGVIPYQFELFSQKDGGGSLLSTNNTGEFNNVGVVGQELSVRVTDNCGASFTQNIVMTSIELDAENKAWATNGTTCTGSVVSLHGMQIGTNSVATYTWTGPNGYSATGKDVDIENVTQSNSGRYYLSITGIQCALQDSVDIKIFDKITNSVSDQICEGNNYSGTKFKSLKTDNLTPGNYSFIDTLKTVTGCDSIVTLNLTINKISYGTDKQTACDKFTWIDGKTYTESNNTAQYTLQNSVGCDSIVTLNLTILKSTYSTDIITACDTYTWRNGITYTASNNSATYTLANAVGCDSIIKLNLTINETSYSTEVAAACGEFTWIDGQTYYASTQTPTYTFPKGNAFGCDSIVSLNLSLTPYPADITAFSPFNFDNINDTFMPGYKIKVFNRYGALVYESITQDDIDRGWDGRNSRGQQVEPGIYFYLLYFCENKPYVKSSVEVLKQ